MSTPEMAIRAEDLVHHFGAVRALDGLSLAVPAGIVFGFLGPNGAGKTTTIRLLLGLVEPTSGKASVLGYDVRKQGDEIRQQTGALLEHTGLYERLSAEDNLEFYARVWHLSAVDRRARIKELLSHLGLWEQRRQSVGAWSHGMKQKLAVARALLHHPALVFLDEPTAGLDPLAAAALRDDLATLVAREGVTVFLTTHNMAEAERLCAKVGVIRQGKLIALGHPDELRARAGGLRVEVVGQAIDDKILDELRKRREVAAADLQNGRLVIALHEATSVAPLVTLLVNAGVEVEEVRKGKASLEEVFLTMMEEGQ